MIKQILQKALQYQEKGDFSSALEIYSQELSKQNSKEEFVFIFGNSANINFLQSNYKKAKELYKQALQIDKNNQLIHFNLGVLYLKLEEFANSKTHLEYSNKLNPKHYATKLNLAICYKNLKLYEKAFSLYADMITSNQNDIDTFYNLGNLYISVEKYDFAVKYYMKVIKQDQNYYKALYGIGLAYHKILKNKKALTYFDRALSIKPDYKDCLFAKSLALLQTGNYKDGWELYKYRFDAKNPLKKPSYNSRYYEGEKLEGKTILVQGEQGFGDNIQFCRFLHYLKSAKKVYFAVREPLKKLMDESFPFVEICGDKDVLYDVDYYISLIDLPRVLGDVDVFEDIKIPYIKRRQKAPIIFDKKRFKIGFCWSGNSDHLNNKNRSIPFGYFEKLVDKFDNIYFYSLQKDNFIELPKRDNLIDLRDVLDDFSITASIVKELDLVLSIDSSLSHLSGALSKNTYLLLPRYREWRWLEKAKTSKWYPSIKIINQHIQNDWGKVFEKLEDEICKMITKI